MVDADKLRRFVEESNRIEGITRPPTTLETSAYMGIICLFEVCVDDLVWFVWQIANETLRRRAGQDVMVGTYVPPRGGPEVEARLDALLRVANSGTSSPWRIHCLYESLHPFMDGNGRSGRALWAWQMIRDGRDPFSLSFLHRFYYDTLAER